MLREIFTGSMPGTRPEPSCPYYFTNYPTRADADRQRAIGVLVNGWEGCDIQEAGGRYHLWYAR